jgi:hypothetical protein
MDNNLICASVSVFPIVEIERSVNCFSLGDLVKAECYRIRILNEVDCFQMNTPIHAEAYKIGNILNVSCFKVCTINKESYLRVSTDVVWLTPDMIAEQFDIYSNVSWRID